MPEPWFVADITVHRVSLLCPSHNVPSVANGYLPDARDLLRLGFFAGP